MSLELAAATVAFIAPWLMEAGKGAASAVGESAVKPVLDWLRAKLGGKAKEAFDDFSQQPESESERAVFQTRLAAALRAEPELADELKTLLEKAGVAINVTQTQTVSGDGAIGVQVGGAQNQVNISKG